MNQFIANNNRGLLVVYFTSCTSLTPTIRDERWNSLWSCYDPLTMRSELALAIATTLFLSSSALAQEAQSATPCIASDERIYEPGKDGVKAPQPLHEKHAETPPKIRGGASLQLIVNKEGRVCGAKVVTASDKSAAKEMADYVLKYWHFSPATKDGTPVAVTFTLNFGPS